MGDHQHPDASRDRKDGPNYEPGYRRLFDADESMAGIVSNREPGRRECDNRNQSADARAQQFPKLREEESTENGFLTETGADSHGEQNAGQRRTIASQVMVRMVDR